MPTMFIVSRVALSDSTAYLLAENHAADDPERALRVKVAESIDTNRQLLVCRMQKGFSPFHAVADPSVAEAHNIAGWRYGEGLLLSL
jgi:hypothetical protein